MTIQDASIVRQPAVVKPLRVLLLTLIPAALAFVLAQLLLAVGLTSPSLKRGEFISSVQIFVAQDRLAALVFGGLILVGWALAVRTRIASLSLREMEVRRIVLALAVIGSAAAWLIARGIFHGYAMSPDEYLPLFQAEIFRSGNFLAPLPPEMAPFHINLQPFFVYVDEAHGLWASGYRPGHALLLALSPDLRGISLLNPLLTGLSVWAAGDIARRLWPDWTLAPVLAALLLLLSPQVLVTAGSGFAYPAHLAFNLLWLALFLRGMKGDRWGPHLAAALVGSFAIGLHQVHVHPLFAAPFLTLLLLGTVGRRAHLVPYMVTYSLALPIWVLWPEFGIWLQTGDASALPGSLAAVEYLADFLRYSGAVAALEAPFIELFLAVNVLRFMLWLSPALLLLVIAALMRPRQLTAIPLAALASVLLTLAANHVLMPNQMLTWGSRYYHPVVGNLLVLALAGGAMLRHGAGKRLFETTLLLVVASGLVLVPLRLVQVERFVAPRAAVQRAIAAIDADIVVVPVLDVWFIGTFVRNDPFLTNHPLVMAGIGRVRGPDDLPSHLRAKRIHVLTEADLVAFGLPRGTLYEPDPSAR